MRAPCGGRAATPANTSAHVYKNATPARSGWTSHICSAAGAATKCERGSTWKTTTRQHVGWELSLGDCTCGRPMRGASALIDSRRATGAQGNCRTLKEKGQTDCNEVRSAAAHASGDARADARAQRARCPAPRPFCIGTDLRNHSSRRLQRLARQRCWRSVGCLRDALGAKQGQ